MTRAQGRLERLRAFLFAPEKDYWLSILRVGLGLQVILYCFALRHDWTQLFSGLGHGIVGRQFPEVLVAAESSFIPTLGHLIRIGEVLGASERLCLLIAWSLLLLAGCGVLTGVFSRASALTAWFIHLCAAKSGGLLSYGVDNFMTIGLFYLMWAPLPDGRALERRWREKPPLDPRLLGFFRRVLQIHLCLIYFSSGLTKALGSGWWNGSNIWRALIRPPFDLIPPEIIVRWKYFLPALGLGICLIELGYPLLIWLKRTRLLWLALVCAMHLGVGLAMGMYLFALIMIVLNLAAFARPCAGTRSADTKPRFSLLSTVARLFCKDDSPESQTAHAQRARG